MSDATTSSPSPIVALRRQRFARCPFSKSSIWSFPTKRNPAVAFRRFHDSIGIQPRSWTKTAEVPAQSGAQTWFSF